jgi:hypothetical protein
MRPNAVPDPFAKFDVFGFRGDPLKFVDALPWLCVTVFAMGLLIAAMFLFRFLRNIKLDEPDDAATLRAKFRELRQQGELTAEEYREIQVRLAEQVMRQAEEEAERKQR